MTTQPDTRPDRYTFEVTRQATETITAMREHCAKLSRYWGERSKESTEAWISFGNQFATLVGSPLATASSVQRDGDLSLYVSPTTGPGIVFGLIWHGRKRTCTTEGCYAWIADDGSTSTWSREQAPILEHEHTPSYPLDAPQPGTWSFHS